VVILDMEAGIEHLARGTSKAVDRMIIVVEPGRRSIETARRIQELARDIGLENVVLVANKVRNQSEKEFIVKSLPDMEFLGFIPYDQTLVEADLANRPIQEASRPIANEINKIYQALVPVSKTPSPAK
jgi:CO dehydrogenase maturation factor